MASPCPHCEDPSSDCFEMLQKRGDSGTLKHIRRQTLDIDCGAGLKERLSFDDANERYMGRHFPQSDEKVYSCPPVYEYVYPGEPTDIVQSAEKDEKVPFLKKTKNNDTINYDTLQRTRMGEVAEEESLGKFLRMFEKYNTPSFIVHGYNWKTVYLKKLLALKPSLSKSFKKIALNEGEIDLLISIAGKCLIVVEVKAISHVVNFTNVVKKAFAQCGKTSNFLSAIGSDLYDSKDIWLLKVVALPSVGRDILAQFNYCRDVSRHIITKENLASAAALHDWFMNLLELHKCRLDASHFDGSLHKRLIGRLIGPASLLEVTPARDELSQNRPNIEVRTAPESIPWTARQITEEHGTAKKIKSRQEQVLEKEQRDPTSTFSHLLQLNPEQLAVKFDDPKHLWLSGQPASGKTVLALMKIDEILNESKNEAESGGGMKLSTPVVTVDLQVKPQELPTSSATPSGASHDAGVDCISTSIADLTLPSSAPAFAVASQGAECTTVLSGTNSVQSSTTLACAPPPDATVGSSTGEDYATASSGTVNCRESVIYFFAGLSKTCLSQVIEDRYHNKQTRRCQVIVSAVRDFSLSVKVDPKSKTFMRFDELPFWIDVLQKKHPTKIIHIFFDEAPYLLQGQDWDQFKREWGNVFDSKRLGYVWCVQSTYYNEVDSGTRVPFDFNMVHLTCVMRLSRQNIDIANMLLKDIKIENKFLNKKFRSGHAVAGYCPVMYRIKCVCSSLKDSYICEKCYDKRIVVLLQHALDDFQVNKQRGSLPEGQFGIKDAALICTDFQKVADLLGHISPQILFAVNRYAVLDTNCMAVCGVEEFRGCERSFVLVDFHNAACEDLKMKEAITRTLGQLVILDCGTFMPTELYEEQIQKMKDAEERRIIQIREIERSAEEMRRLNLIFITYVGKGGKTLMNLTDSK